MKEVYLKCDMIPYERRSVNAADMRMPIKNTIDIAIKKVTE